MKILVQTFTTPGFVPWVETFLDSLSASQQDPVDVRLDAVNLSDEQMASLRNRYASLEIHNLAMDLAQVSADMGVPEETVKRWKAEIERGNASKENFPYKILISVNQRYRKMDQVIRESREKGYDLLVHCDADVLVRKPLAAGGLARHMANRDVGFYIHSGQLNNIQHHRKVFGAFLCFNLKRDIDPFVRAWMAEIDSIPFMERWKGFGQSVLWYAYNQSAAVDFVNLFEIEKDFLMSRKFDEQADIWFGSNVVDKKIKRYKKPGSLEGKSKAELTRQLYRLEIDAIRGEDT